MHHTLEATALVYIDSDIEKDNTKTKQKKEKTIFYS
jgi:hypothetical protein